MGLNGPQIFWLTRRFDPFNRRLVDGNRTGSMQHPCFIASAALSGAAPSLRRRFLFSWSPFNSLALALSAEHRR